METNKTGQFIVFFVLSFFLLTTHVFAMGLSSVFQTGAAYLTHVAAHEMGHNALGHMAGGRDVRMDFFQARNGGFFVGVSSASELDPESVLPFRAAGIAASNHTFNIALSGYRAHPTTFNKALLFFSGTDFLWYSVWAFYIKGSDDPSYDPVGIAQETGLSSEAVLSVALVQTALNAFRAYSGDDTYIPYVSVNERRMDAGVRVRF